MSVTIRTLRGDEGTLLKQLFITMSVETPTAFAGTVQELEQRSDAEWLEFATSIASSPNMEAFVVENDGDVQGFVTGAILTKKRLAMFENTTSEDEGLSDTTILGRMWVAPEARGQRIAQVLIDAVLDWAREKGQRRVTLAVSDGNVPASRAYERAGFVPTGHSIPHPNYPELPIHRMEFVF
jgi:RimJ/RimL family protein N-acetyltransferase